jgi:hypothetical protein
MRDDRHSIAQIPKQRIGAPGFFRGLACDTPARLCELSLLRYQKLFMVNVLARGGSETSGVDDEQNHRPHLR